MNSYVLKMPVTAVQYTDGDSVGAVAEVVKRHRTQPSWDTMRGPLIFRNGGAEVVLDLGPELVVLSDSAFHTTFAIMATGTA